MPMISATIRGKKVVDYRDGGTRWTDNAALCIADYLTKPTYGMGFPAGDRARPGNFNAEANHCDEIVQTSPIGGGIRLPQDHFVAEKTKTYTYYIGGPRGERGTGTRTLPGAFTIDSDTLGFDTGDRVMLTGNSLPPGVAANSGYYVIRQSDGDDYILRAAQIHRSPVIQLATSLANARRASRSRSPATAAERCGCSTLLAALDRYRQPSDRRFRSGLSGRRNPLPAPLVNGGSYYWIDRGHQQVYYETTHGLLAYGSGMLAYHRGAARANQPVTLTSVGVGNYLVYKQYQKRFTCNGVSIQPASRSDIMRRC